jgi:hypothetical protein
MAKPTFTKMLQDVSKKPASQRSDALKYYVKHVPNLQAYLHFTFHPAAQFDLPAGEPPYKPTELVDAEALIYKEIRKANNLLTTESGGNPNIHRIKKETMFIQMLEYVHPDDAKLLVAMKDKKCPIKNITYKLVSDTFENMLPAVKKAK